MMNIGVIGPGAMGTFLSGLLGKTHDVRLLGRKERELKKVEIVGKTRLKSDVYYTSDPSDLSKDELIIICTKSFDTEEALKTLKPHISSEVRILTLQNGLENEEIISRYVGKERTIGGITSNGVTFQRFGKVKHAGKGETIIGSYPHGSDERSEQISEIFDKCGIDTKVSENIIGHIWKKAIVNSAINPLTALVRVNNGALIEDDSLFELMKDVTEESSIVAEEYVELPGKEPVEETKKVAEQTSDNISSMLQDVKKGNRTEVEQINGAIKRKGDNKGVSTPLNQMLYALIKGIENSYG